MRRYVIYGAGAVGGVIGAELALADHNVVLVARGAHRAALADGGLRYVTPEGDTTVRVPVIEHPREIDFGPDDIVVIATKSQDTEGAIDALTAVAPRSTPIVCAQNGVANEAVALRRFASVFGVCIVIPATHLRPGEVVVHAGPRRGVIQLGRFPEGRDTIGDEIAMTLSSANFIADAHDDVRPYKYAKLLTNLANSAQAVLEPTAVASVTGRARDEGRRVLEAARIPVVADNEFAQTPLPFAEVSGHERSGGSTWQSLARGAAGVEVDYLNGEIVLLGRRHGVPTPVNELLQRLCHEAVRNGDPPGSCEGERFSRMLEERTQGPV